MPPEYQMIWTYLKSSESLNSTNILFHRKWENKHFTTYGISLSGTQEMVKGVQQVLIRDAGITETKIVKDKRTIDNYSMSYHGMDNVAKVFEYLYPAAFNPDGICLKRKYDRMKEGHDTWQARHPR
jgi:hypothetical protein